MPRACVLAQSIPQFTRPGQSLKNIMTAPRSRFVFRVQPAVRGTCPFHGSEYENRHGDMALLQIDRTTSILRTYGTVRSWFAQLATTSAAGSAPFTWQ